MMSGVENARFFDIGNVITSIMNLRTIKKSIMKMLPEIKFQYITKHAIPTDFPKNFRANGRGNVNWTCYSDVQQGLFCGP